MFQCFKLEREQSVLGLQRRFSSASNEALAEWLGQGTGAGGSTCHMCQSMRKSKKEEITLTFLGIMAIMGMDNFLWIGFQEAGFRDRDKERERESEHLLRHPSAHPCEPFPSSGATDRDVLLFGPKHPDDATAENGVVWTEL